MATIRQPRPARAVTGTDAATRIIGRVAERPAAIVVERIHDPRAAEDARPPLPSPVDAAPRNLGWGTGRLLTPADARALIAAASPRSPMGARNRALLALMYRSGLRPGEVVALSTGDVDPVAGTVAVRAGRPRTRRTTGVDAATLELVASWLEVRRERGIAESAPLFCTPAGAPLSAAHLRQLTARLGWRAGIRARVHPMALRDANAAELADEGVLGLVIDRHLGLAPSGAARDVDVLDEDAIEAIAARVWTVPARPPSGGRSGREGGRSGRR